MVTINPNWVLDMEKVHSKMIIFIYYICINYKYMKPIITRLAPSPTSSFCHIGNCRTLLYNYFLAKRHGGKFLVRLEDTDRDRYTPEFLQYFKDTCDWLDIVPDYSFWNPDPTIGSFIQSERDYSKHIQTLLKNNVVASFASEVGIDVEEENIIKYVNKLRPTLFISFKKSEENSIAYFKGSFTESKFGRDLSREVGDKLKITQSGKAHNLLKNTKSVTLVLFGNYYQYHKVADVLEVILKSLNKSFEN